MFSTQEDKLGAKDKDKNKEGSDVKVFSTVLRTGEVLYIPPYWMAHSEVVHNVPVFNASTFRIPVSVSLSLDVLSVSQEQLLLMPAFHMALPFSNQNLKSKEEKIVSAQV